jgi:hypothetical protein
MYTLMFFSQLRSFTKTHKTLDKPHLQTVSTIHNKSTDKTMFLHIHFGNKYSFTQKVQKFVFGVVFSNNCFTRFFENSTNEYIYIFGISLNGWFISLESISCNYLVCTVILIFMYKRGWISHAYV